MRVQKHVPSVVKAVTLEIEWQAGKWDQHVREILDCVKQVRIVARVVLLVDTLPEAEPIGNETRCDIPSVRSPAVILVMRRLYWNPPVLRLSQVEAIDDADELNGSYDRSQNISQEEMPKPYKPEWRDEDVPESKQNLFTRSLIEAVERVDADGDDYDQAHDSADLQGDWVVFIHLYHAYRVNHAHQPDEEEHQAYPVKLMVNQLIILIDLKDESIVDTVTPEDLYIDGGSKDNPDEYEGKDVDIFAAKK